MSFGVIFVGKGTCQRSSTEDCESTIRALCQSLSTAQTCWRLTIWILATVAYLFVEPLEAVSSMYRTPRINVL